MNSLNALIRVLDAVTEATGRFAALFSLLLVLVTCYVVITRYGFNIGSIAVQETLTYCNALLFMLGAAWTLKHDGHVRVDIFYGRLSARGRLWIDLFGALFLLLPVSIFIIWISWDYVLASWRIREQSGDTGGLPWVYLLKTLIPVLGLSLILQGLAEILRLLGRLIEGGRQPGSGTAADEGPAR